MKEESTADRIKKLRDEIRSYKNAVSWAETESAKKWLQSSIEQCEQEIQGLLDDEATPK